jgi:polar amino acid transport system permease protein
VAERYGGAERFIVLPQSLRIAVPALVNEVVALIKYSSLASVIGLAELTRRGEYMVATTFRALEVYFLVAILYLVLCLSVSQLSAYIERKYSIPGYRRAVI